MRIIKIREIPGPNLFAHFPILSADIELGEWMKVSSAECGDFSDKLIRALPGLAQHRCSPGYEGGFVERLKTGTYWGHIIEHVALELSTLAGIGVGFGKTVSTA